MALINPRFMADWFSSAVASIPPATTATPGQGSTHRASHWASWFMLAAFAVIVVMSSALQADASRAQPTLPIIDIMINDVPMTIEVASTARQRYMGLSFRQTLDENEGMLFVYEREQPLSFTMRDTLIPLSIAFLSKDLVINEIHDMDVGPGQIFEARRAAQYALEVNQGWFEKNGIKAGDQIVRQ